jgi:hypothetical protein
MKPKDILTKEFLSEHYVNQRKSDKTIADELGLRSHHSVYQARLRHNIHRHSLKDSSYILTKDFLNEYYIKQNMTLKQVAQFAGFQRKSIVSKALKKHGIPQREHTRSQAVINRKPRKHHTIPGRYFYSLQHSAKNRGLEFNLTLNELWEIFSTQDGKCALSGLEIRFHKPGEKFTTQTASVDRIDSNLGYIKSNIRWVHKDINYMKMDLSDERFLYLCHQILQHNRNNIQ